MTFDFTPRFQPQNQAAPTATVTETPYGSPKWIVDSWKELFFMFPSDGLSERVKQAESWAKERGYGN